MITKLDLYKVFSQVVKSKSFSKAAKELYMTQPAVSQAIMALERELDIRLFNRTPKGVSLTNEGSLLFEYINSAMNLIKLGEEKILEFQNLAIGELKIGVGDTISKYFLVPFLEKFHNKYPNIKFKINNSTTLELCELLKSGDIDIAICNLPIEDPSIESSSRFEVGDIFICGEKFKHLSRESIEFSEICKYPLIFLEPNSNSRKYVEKFLLSKGVKISPEFELGSYDLLLEFAKINLGVACVVKEFTKEYLDEGTIYQVKLKEDIPRRSIGICHLKSVPMSIASTKFVEIINNGI
ncbi:LysR family transcriptional regulator [Clostridium paraputrificum]|uniref:LysR family transcriptional regulator n=1 Tax=Clostridium paraputrificum TaxID=29363 RepID=UPI000C06BAA5|nr:LysR family transcriptional regulator [Clostridium paraputrificum]